MVDRMLKSLFSLHYFRSGRRVSFVRGFRFRSLIARTALAAAGMLAALLTGLPGWSQYPGQITNNSGKTPELRAIGVLEWIGPAGKPKQCRLVPVTVFDQGQLQDASIYMARPQPMALAGEVEYQLEEDGKTVGLFDIENAGQEQGSWVGYGTWKPLPAPSKANVEVAKVDDWEDPDDDRPVLHRKKHPGDAQTAGSSGNSSANGESASSAPAPDPDRPVLHKSDESASSSAPAKDPDRPKLKADQPPAQDAGHVDSLPEISDPDRPRLMRGKPGDNGLKVLPSLMGLPPDMEQAVAVSDAQNRPDHVWNYKWANAADEAKLKAQLEEIARKALGLENPAPATTPQAKRVSTSRKSLKQPPQPLEPAPLADEHFRVFELAYGSGATMVLSAHTEGPLDKAKFVTLIAQPDLYGNVLVLLKHVTDGEHLDDNPRMKLIDAVDAMADNRGELLFELRGETQRQFALYRVLRGQAQKLFVGGGAEVGSEN
jgi:hypothetical protein